MGLTANVTCCWVADHFIPGHPTCGELHSHTWIIYVGVRRKPGYKPLDNGMIHDFKEIRSWVRDVIDAAGPLLNDIVAIPTCENFLEAWIIPQLRRAMPDHLEVAKVQLWENDKYFCEWTN